ncbi:MAG: outer membrane beta-barrel protein [Gammaproteobacteria bacterium]
MSQPGVVVAAALLAALAQPVAAHECPECSDAASTTFWHPGWNLAWYAGAGLDYTEFQDWTIERVEPATFASTDEDGRSSGFRLTAGVEFLRYFAVEASYADLGEATFSGQNDGSGAVFAAGEQRGAIDLDGYALQLVARVPVKDTWSVAGKAGFWQWHARERFGGVVYQAGTPTPTSFGNSDDGIRFAWGAGLEYDGFKPIRVGIEYRAATFEAPLTDSFGTSDVSSLGVSLSYFF